MTARSKLILAFCILALASFSAWKWRGSMAQKAEEESAQVESDTMMADSALPENSMAPKLLNSNLAAAASTLLAQRDSEPPPLPPPGAYEPKDNIVEIEISEYAGYAGLIVANGGLEPGENSEFFKKGGFKVKFTLKEEESRSELNAGKLAAVASTVDALPIYGGQLQAVAPVQIGYSRGADGVVVRKEIKRINNLKGQVLAVAQFSESDFFIRFLAQEAGLGIHILAGLKESPDPSRINLVYCVDGFSAGDLFLKDIQQDSKLLAGCVTWAPKTTEVVDQSKGEAKLLVTTLNLLMVADILLVNKGFAHQHPDKVAVIVAGLLEGNRKVRDNPEAFLDTIGRVFNWDRDKTRLELSSVQLSNLPENLAFFAGTLESAACFGDIYRSAVAAYGKDLIKNPVPASEFIDTNALVLAEQSGVFKGQEIAIPTLHSGDIGLSDNPLLSKDIRFLFAPNSFTLPLQHKNNQKNLEALKQMLQISPGSTILLRGHVDNSKVEEFYKQGGQKYLDRMNLRAMELSKNRAKEIKRLLVERYEFDVARIQAIGRGWDEPVGANSVQNRRVEAQWFTVE